MNKYKVICGILASLIMLGLILIIIGLLISLTQDKTVNLFNSAAGGVMITGGLFSIIGSIIYCCLSDQKKENINNYPITNVVIVCDDNNVAEAPDEPLVNYKQNDNQTVVL